MKYLTFKDLQSLGIVSNWPTLARMIENAGFPAGVRLSEAKRAWSEDEVRTWLGTRAIKPATKADQKASV